MKPAAARLRPLRYKGTMALAFERLFEREGIPIPEGMAFPTLTTAAWTGPRDRA